MLGLGGLGLVVWAWACGFGLGLGDLGLGGLGLGGLHYIFVQLGALYLGLCFGFRFVLGLKLGLGRF